MLEYGAAPFPSGILYWEERDVLYPVNRREGEAALAERWRPWYHISNKEFK